MSDQFIGEIRIFAGNYAPEDWALCNGSLLTIQGNEVLFSLLGTTYGGDGAKNFALPDLRGRLPVSQGIPAYSTTKYVPGVKAGSESVSLNEAEMPAHSHALQALSTPGTTGTAKGNYLAQTANSAGGTNQDAFYLQATAPVKTTITLPAGSVLPSGGSQPHANVMPCQGVNFIIALRGTYPDLS
jgi:microcystin-dependent protein